MFSVKQALALSNNCLEVGILGSILCKFFEG